MIDASDNIVASYTYDTWGALLSSSGSMANINPLRYRGYYYDIDTGMYYLQSRYYDPSLKRFINADIYTDTCTGVLGTNMFAYCENNAVNASDPTGQWVARAIIATSSSLIFGGIAYSIGKALGISQKALIALTASFAAIGLIIGLWKGVAILNTINKLIKPVIYFFRNPGKVKFGLKLLSIIQFEIHNPHHGKPIHFVIRVFLKSGQNVWEWWFRK